MSDDSVYYKIYLNRDNLLTVVCMQWFDENDYDKDRFYKDQSDYALRFDTEEEAVDFLVETFRKEYIDEAYRTKSIDWESMKK